MRTPEIRGLEKADGNRSKNWLRNRLPVGTKIVIKTVKAPRFRDEKGKYGRWLADIWVDGVNLNDKMVELGLAECKDYQSN